MHDVLGDVGVSVKSKRLRFEILKRDGFRCRYCGADAVQAVLHVDHVIPSSRGGTDDPQNLITACAACNGGKSDIRLDESLIAETEPAEELRKQAEDIRTYLEAVKEREGAKDDVREYVFQRFMSEVGCRVNIYDEVATYQHLSNAIESNGLDSVLTAVDSLARRSSRGRMSQSDALKYFHGTLRVLRENAAQNRRREW